ncbi:MAG: hypothetical protein KJO12_02235 [Ignavibacteria bacterium]|nr:hypothetical protein [Ignavibacteria bacterium]MBT8386205.1 hypothetical protein [Ignavibacteria bacterium]
MKKILILFVLTSLCAITFISCSTTVNNGITIKNLASGDIHLNFRAELTTVKAGGEVTLSSLPKGVYDYNTTYEIPPGVTSSSAEEGVAGQLTIKAGTKILIVYSSAIIGDAYVLSASLTSSDDLSDEGDPNPVAP